MIVDCHCHIFTPKIIENVSTRLAMVEELRLNVQDASPRYDPLLLEESAFQNNVDLCLLLPTAAPDKVRAENDRHVELAAGCSRLRALATLHPAMEYLSEEIERIFQFGIRGFKFSSFSQRFELDCPDVDAMLSEIVRIAGEFSWRPTIIFDTFTRADIHFGAEVIHLTKPDNLKRVVRRHPEIDFIGAHMGGLAESWDELRKHSVPLPNFFLDTSNAAHTLHERDFVSLLEVHGPDHILFGTDWPWFHHADEIPLIRSLLDKAGFNQSDQDKVFGGNACRLFGISPDNG